MTTDKHLRVISGLSVPYASHPQVRALKRSGRRPSLHGTKLWGASQILMDYLASTTQTQPKTVIDAGCGWGLSGIWCAKHLQATVASLDADPDVIPYLELTAKINGTEVTPIVGRFEDLGSDLLSATDLLIGADICFWDELVDPVMAMITSAIEGGTKRIVIAEPQRAPFLAVCEHILEHFGGELLEWRAPATKTVGALLVIENA